MYNGGSGNEAAAAKIHIDFEVVRERFYPSLSRILLMLPDCRKTNSKIVNLQCNPLSEGNQT